MDMAAQAEDAGAWRMSAKIIASIVGARPQFIKAAPVSRVLRRMCKEVLIHTGQHYDFEMSKVFFDELDLPEPDFNLGIGSGTHAEQTGRMLIDLEKKLSEIKPDWVLVYGDTNSTLAGALAAAKMNIPLAHVEAGLRSYDKSMPEEINRVLCDHISDILFCPTETAVKNLAAEGVVTNVNNVGDVMYDALLYNLVLARKCSPILSHLKLTRC
jgi:UDP-N-acetylglucosamine 2-epimerase